MKRKSLSTAKPKRRTIRSRISRQVRVAVPDHEGVPVNVAIVDYGSGNLHSARKAFERAARETGLSGTINVTRDPDAVFRADRIVLPG
jgi:hypothetical protein